MITARVNHADRDRVVLRQRLLNLHVGVERQEILKIRRDASDALTWHGHAGRRRAERGRIGRCAGIGWSKSEIQKCRAAVLLQSAAVAVNQRLIIIKPRAGTNHGWSVALVKSVNNPEAQRDIVLVHIEILRERKRRERIGLRNIIQVIPQSVVNLQARRHLPVILPEEMIVVRLILDRRIANGFSVCRVATGSRSAPGRHIRVN